MAFAWWVRLALLLVPRGTYVFLRLSLVWVMRVKEQCSTWNESREGCLHAHARVFYYGALFCLLSVSGVMRLGGLHE